MLQEIIFWIAVGITVILFLLWINKFSQFRKDLLPAKDRLGVITILPILIIEVLILILFKIYSIDFLHLIYLYPLVLFVGQFIIALLIPKSITKKWQDKW